MAKLTDKQFRQYCDLVYNEAGINLTSEKRELLNARLANWLVRRFPSEIDSGSQRLFEAVSELDRSLPKMVRRSVEKMTDEEVLNFISEHYAPDRISATQLLHMLRHKEGKSCEQKRFGGLFRRFRESQTGGLFDG